MDGQRAPNCAVLEGLPAQRAVRSGHRGVAVTEARPGLFTIGMNSDIPGARGLYVVVLGT